MLEARGASVHHYRLLRGRRSPFRHDAQGRIGQFGPADFESEVGFWIGGVIIAFLVVIAFLFLNMAF